MNKKPLIKFILLFVLVIVIICVWLWVASIDFWKNTSQQTEPGINPNLTAQDAADWNAPFLREIKTEFIEPEELNKMGLSNNPNARLQVLERDANGNVTAYKKIYKEEDVIKYIYDPEGIGGDGSVTTTTDSQTPTTN